MTNEPIAMRPSWAMPVFIAGVLCSLVVAVVSNNYFAALAGGMPPSLGLGYSMALAPFLLAAVPLLWIGGLAMIRPWSGRRPWLRLLVIVGVIGWLLVVLQGPSFLPH